MGTTFNNLHIRTNGRLSPEQVADHIRAGFLAKGYTPVDSPDEADVHAAVLGGPGDGWISVYCEDFRFSGGEDMRALASEYAAAFQTDALALLCFDSDFLLMNLVNTVDGTDAWMRIGHPYGVKRGRRVNRSAWRNKVTDYASFSAAVTADYACAEDALAPLGALLSLNPEHAVMDVEYLDDLESGAPVIRLYFSLPEKQEQRPPKFKWFTYSMNPLYSTGDATSMSATVMNIGGESKGLQIVLSGSFIENDEVTFTDTEIMLAGLGGGMQSTPITMKKVQAPNGQWVMVWTDPAFRLPAGIDITDRENSGRATGSMIKMIHLFLRARGNRRKFLDIKRENSGQVTGSMIKMIHFSFRARGNRRKFLDIAVSFFPIKNPQEGGVSLWPWMGYPSKRAFFDEQRRDMAKSKAENPDHPWPVPESDDYDLDD